MNVEMKVSPNKISIQTSDLQNGLYIVKLIDQDNKSSSKILMKY